MTIINHPIVPAKTVVTVVDKVSNTGRWQPSKYWESLTVDTGEGVLIQNVRHKCEGNNHAFKVEVGDKVCITYVPIVAGEQEPWYYTSIKAT